MKKPPSEHVRVLVADVEDTSAEALDNDRVGGVEQLADRGLKARNGVKASQASSKTRAACGYFVPQGEAANAAQGIEGGLGGQRGVDRAQPGGDRGGVAAGDRAQRAR